MKNILIIILLYICSFTEDIKFLDIPFSSTKEYCTVLMKEKNFILKKSIQNEKNLNHEFTFEGKFAGEEVIILMSFYKNRLYSVFVIFTKSFSILSFYKETKERLIKKYGLPDKDNYIFVKPYYDGDGYEEQAIKLLKAAITAEWYIEFCSMTLFIAPTLNLIIQYKHEVLYKEYNEYKTANENKDF